MAGSKRPASRRGDGGAATDVRRDEFNKVTNTLKTMNVTREEFLRATESIRDNLRALEIQFQRIAQMQADIDSIKAVLKRLTDQ